MSVNGGGPEVTYRPSEWRDWPGADASDDSAGRRRGVWLRRPHIQYGDLNR